MQLASQTLSFLEHSDFLTLGIETSVIDADRCLVRNSKSKLSMTSPIEPGLAMGEIQDTNESVFHDQWHRHPGALVAEGRVQVLSEALPVLECQRAIVSHVINDEELGMPDSIEHRLHTVQRIRCGRFHVMV